MDEWWNQLIRKRDALKRKAIISNSPSEWLDFKKLRNKLNNKIKQAKANYFSNSCSEFEDNPGKLSETINEITSRKSKDNHVKSIDINNETVSKPFDLAEAFNVYFSEIGETLGKTFENQEDAGVKFSDYVGPTEKRFILKPTTTSKVYRLLNTLSEVKATGLDSISSKIIKISADIITASMTDIFNAAITTGIFPDEWKIARVKIG